MLSLESYSECITHLESGLSSLLFMDINPDFRFEISLSVLTRRVSVAVLLRMEAFIVCLFVLIIVWYAVKAVFPPLTSHSN